MEKTVCELFAGVGGFRCGLNSINCIEDTQKPEKWNTVWFSQWEPDKKSQWAHDCYVHRFGTRLDLKGIDTTNIDIASVPKKNIPNHNLLVGGFPCQDYSVARSLNGEQGIEGKKGVLWWSILDIIQAKKPPFILLENVDRLLKSPSKQRGRDFGIILACLQNEGYSVEWRVINAAQYGAAQRRKRTFIFAYKNRTKYARAIRQKIKYKPSNTLNTKRNNVVQIINSEGFFARGFSIQSITANSLKSVKLDSDIVNVSNKFKFAFESSGVMMDGVIYSAKTTPIEEKATTLKEILQDNVTLEVDKKYYIPNKKLYYTNKQITHSDETKHELPTEHRQTWQYLKGAKKRLRTAKSGHQYVFSEGPIPMIDSWDKPARTMLTSEGTFNRSTHIVKDLKTNKIRILTPIETERLQGFPDNWTKECLVDSKIVPMPERTRYFCMGNALVVDMIQRMAVVLNDIFDNE